MGLRSIKGKDPENDSAKWFGLFENREGRMLKGESEGGCFSLKVGVE